MSSTAEAGFPGEAVGGRVGPLAVGQVETEGVVGAVVGLHIDLEGNDAEDFGVDVLAVGDEAGERGLKEGAVAGLELVFERSVVGGFRVGKGSVPGADFRVADGGHVGAREEVERDAVADGKGVGEGGPVLEVLVRGVLGRGERGSEGEAGDSEQSAQGEVLLRQRV